MNLDLQAMFSFFCFLHLI